jgi:hypothetical protein
MLGGSRAHQELHSYMLAQVVTQAQNAAQTGIGIGAAIAIVCSWQRNRSILWAILAGILSWLYVLYFAATREPGERK